MIKWAETAGQDICCICAMIARAMIQADYGDELKAGKDVIIPAGKYKFNKAVTMAPTVLFQNPAPVCWDHIAGHDANAYAEMLRKNNRRFVTS